jgi:hypothetical protein
MKMSMLLTVAASLSDEGLLTRLANLAGQERHTTVELVAHLAELEVRKLYRAHGHGSLFSYCTEVLRLSEHAAYKRIEAARIACMFPVVLDRLADGSINLTTLRLIGPHLRAEDHLAVLAAAAGRSKREVEELMARLAPEPDVVASVRKLPSAGRSSTLTEPGIPLPAFPVAGAGAAMQPVVPGPGSPTQGPDPAPTPSPTPVAAPAQVPVRARRPEVTASAPERYRVQFTIGSATHENLRVVQDLLRREIRDGDVAVIFDRALRLLRADIERKKLGAVSTPRVERGATCEDVGAVVEQPPVKKSLVKKSRHISAAIKRTVWRRDQGRCAFIGAGGRRCRERAYLEFHHIEPYALGGETTAGNVSLRCRAHNVHEAEVAFGADVIAQRKREAGATTRSGASRADAAAERPA